MARSWNVECELRKWLVDWWPFSSSERVLAHVVPWWIHIPRRFMAPRKRTDFLKKDTLRLLNEPRGGSNYNPRVFNGENKLHFTHLLIMLLSVAAPTKTMPLSPPSDEAELGEMRRQVRKPQTRFGPQSKAGGRASWQYILPCDLSLFAYTGILKGLQR